MLYSWVKVEYEKVERQHLEATLIPQPPLEREKEDRNGRGEGVTRP